jgi:predicted MFS family arabinose efflux permease
LECFLVFLSGIEILVVGIILWGIDMGAQESIIRAVVADIVPGNRRARDYGLFNTGVWVAWFLGSALMGVLYERSLVALAAFSVASQLASLPLLSIVKRHLKSAAKS